MAIRITSDSTCDLGNLAEKYNVGVLPMAVTLDGEVYYDGVSITPQDIFAFVTEKKILPKTSAPSIGDYEEFFKEQLAYGDEIIHFNISSKSSASHNFAKQAAESFNGKVRVIDSMALSTGQGLLVLKAAEMSAAGKSADEIEETINELRLRVNTSFVPDSLDYLYKGGRVSKMTLYGANLLKIHPQIQMEQGQLVPGKKYRGKMTVCIKQYVEDLKNAYPKYDKTRCFVTHSCADEELVALAKAKVKELFAFDEVLETVAGATVTSHCGRNTLGVLFIYEE
ncbi:MAG: DegV family protein [Clostridia bacterium]|nr:DegV family protein [Clostridia bacterium]